MTYTTPPCGDIEGELSPCIEQFENLLARLTAPERDQVTELIDSLLARSA